MHENMIFVDTLEVPELDIYNVLSENMLYHVFEPREGLFIAESAIVIGRALDAGYEPYSLLVAEEELEREAKEIIIRIKEFPEVKIYCAKGDTLKKITGYNITRGVLCAMRRKKLKNPYEICEGARRIAVLENVSNPTNVGAIMRNAAALNMDAVLFTKGSSDPLYRRAIRVSMGTVFQIPWTFLTQGKEIEELKSMGFKTVSLALTDSTVDLDDKNLAKEEKLAILLGSEGYGLKAETIEASDYCVKIPMTHGVDSLNVAACSAVTFWELQKYGQLPDYETEEKYGL